MISELLEDLREKDIRLWAHEGRIRYDAAPGVLTSELAARLREHREELLRHLEDEAAAPRPEDGEIRLRRLTPGGRPAVLFVLPAAGAGPAMYRRWAVDAPSSLDVVAVHAPGREDRLEEQPYTRVAPLADRIASAVLAHGDRPFVLFGHSAGALVGHEAAKRLAGSRLELFVAAASPAPDAVAVREPELSDERLLDALAAWGAAPSELLADPSVRAALLSGLRGDLSVMADCAKRLSPSERLDVPLLAFYGGDDPLVSLEECGGWRGWTTSWFRAQRVPGDHFFPATAGPRMFGAILRALTRGRAAGANGRSGTAPTSGRLPPRGPVPRPSARP